MDVYRIINEATSNKKFFDEEDLNKLFDASSEKILFSIVQQREQNEEFADIAELVLKNRITYSEAKHDEKLDDFLDDFNSSFKRKITKDRKETLENFFNYFDSVKENARQIVRTAIEKPDAILYKLFYNEYKTKTAFTWKAFKEVKRRFEKNHPLEGENIYNLKSLLEKDRRMPEKITDNTLFSASSHTLTQETLDKIAEKFQETE